AGLDTQSCVTCHQEHEPERTRSGGVTIAADFCGRCHAEVLTDRPSHKAFALTSCTNRGCHAFHDNRALYQDFFAKHLHEPDLLSVAKVALRTDGQPVQPRAKAALTRKDEDAPPQARGGVAPELWELVLTQFEASSHARAGVNCTGCHRRHDPSSGSAKWETK